MGAPKESPSGSMPGRPQALGEYLANVRKVRMMTLREVEEATGHEVSNAYLSQLETGKIAKPSPNMLHCLAEVYGIRYDDLMRKAGYIASAGQPAAGSKHGRAATFADDDLTPEEEEELLRYLAFLRSRRRKE